MTNPEITALAEELEARHRDTWPLQIGLGDLINEDGPRAAAALRALLAERDGLRGALERIRDEYLLNHTSKWARKTAAKALSALAPKDPEQ